MNRLQHLTTNKVRFGSIIPILLSKKKKSEKKQHEKDNAIEEFADIDADEKSRKNKKEKGMGISDKAKRQHSDESDTINDNKK